MRGFKTLLSATALLAALAMAPAAQAQISINIGVQPVCSYGYYGYAPYQCAPMGYYGSGYFYNGIFVGMGPWAGYGYNHGWGSHRFVNDGGGRYHGGVSRVAYRGNEGRGQAQHSGGSGHQVKVNSQQSHTSGARPAENHGASHGSAPHGSESHGGGQSHGGEQHGGDHK
ncbi:MAG: hypothetical protein WB608_25300 [Terracidiphilus sp.]